MSLAQASVNNSDLLSELGSISGFILSVFEIKHVLD